MRLSCLVVAVSCSQEVIRALASTSASVSTSADMLRKYFIPVEAESRALVDELLHYAKTEITKHYDAIAQNLAKNHLTNKTIDLLWPGAGYLSVACGGQWQVFSELKHLIKIDRICGASGGACSAILAAPNTDARFLLNAYLAYAKHQETEGLSSEAWRVTDLWREVYLEQVRRRGVAHEQEKTLLLKKRFIAVSSHMISAPNTVFHDFSSAEELANAGVASGELTPYGMTKGVFVSDSDNPNVPRNWYGSPQRYMDGGLATHLSFVQDADIIRRSENYKEHRPPNPFLTYSTFFPGRTSNAIRCTKESVEWLFRQGVDDTVEFLLNPSLSSTERIMLHRADQWDYSGIIGGDMTISRHGRQIVEEQIFAQIREVRENNGSSSAAAKNFAWGNRAVFGQHQESSSFLQNSFGTEPTNFIRLSNERQDVRAPPPPGENDDELFTWPLIARPHNSATR
ncbi:unnamed protein product [Amoebophrya sp. A120]|nr:unnamed protein product [Amoebophrya sp. A120]|eukprot:GSA120T00005280001.1